MGLYISGMEMPNSCDVCPFCDYEQANCLACNDRNTLPHYDGLRPDWCPLVSVPAHGRLIDADSFLATIRPVCDEDARAACTFETAKILMFEHIKSTPTVIPPDPPQANTDVPFRDGMRQNMKGDKDVCPD